jgi:hypothetical protein
MDGEKARGGTIYVREAGLKKMVIATLDLLSHSSGDTRNRIQSFNILFRRANSFGYLSLTARMILKN